MFLKRLELQGFKSFADKTVLDFVNGATAVVGPNGSGKSNISDAIRWVIGEMSAKSLRGSNMQDVIFAGTETRKKVNFAEVSLVLDNSTKMFNIDFDEVVVTRRLFRSGESVYQINRANCRLRDIHELFMDTGLGRDGYSIIGQGNVSQILSTKAEDRRSLFEEAAGVSKYKYKKEEAEKKLANTEDNLVRINDIVIELEGQLAPLKNQSEKARKYLELYGEYKTLDVNLSLLTLDKNEILSQKTEEQYKSVEDELSRYREKESEAEVKIASLYEEQKKCDDNKTQKNNELIENESRSMSNANEISISENNIKNNQSLIKRIDAEIENIKKRNAEKEAAIVKFKDKIAEKEAEAEIILSEFDSAKDENDDIAEKQKALGHEIDAIKNEAVEKLNIIASQRTKVNGIENLRSSFIERRDAVEAEIKSHSEGVEQTKAEIEDDEKQIEIKKQKLDKMHSTVSAHEENLEKLKKEQEEIIRAFNDMNVEYNSKSSQKKILEGMENDYAGYAKSVKAVLKADELKKKAIYGTVSGLIDVKKEYVTAIEIALGGALQNIIVESEDDAKAAIAYLRETKSGRATFLPISSVKGRSFDNLNSIKRCNGFVGVACDLVSYDKKYDGIMKSLLGRVVVADNIDNAIAINREFDYKFKTVTLEGDLLNAGGSMSGGSVNKQSGFLSRAAEIKTLSHELVVLSDKIREYREKRENNEKDIKIINNQLSSYLPLMREYEDEILRLENTCEHLKASIKSGALTEQNYALELSQIEKNLSSSSDDIARILSEIRRNEKEAKELQDKVEALNIEYERITFAREEKNKSLMDKTMLLAALQKDIQLNRDKIESTNKEIADGNTEIETKKEDKEKIYQANDALYAIIKEKNNMAVEIKKLSDELKKKLSVIDEQKEKITAELKSIQSSNKDLTDTLLKLQQELSRVENKRVKLNIERESILNRLWDDYELTYNSAAEIRTEVEEEKESFERLAELKKSIKALGSVNMDAIEKYKEVKERHEFLTSQKMDLEQSKDNLNKIISSMQELMEEHFGTQFAEINQSFSEVFKELFGGGSGKLSLSNPDNILESGIEIEVQLPGKGLQNINLYSGGEKSFIAIALLFAILRVKPTPFCILDEIDAALDDVNVARFATYLKNYVEQTQFIVITHRRGTMEAANILYGVTMQEKGVSKLLSLQIDDVDESLVK